ncbi:pentapeptide repeat-containing protein [Streptomyces sp. WAC 05379]|uniref:pentapeptide repeat-containing protein n=1 Tax=Streptomyces sp. WAC 05379 TaxID=2203207 RepID=UPI000F73A48F|nr:pentapeptide repeat-containing protein [Streptomyces sp. WAC 05379]
MAVQRAGTGISECYGRVRVGRPALRHSLTRRRAAERRQIRNAGRRGDSSHGGTPWLALAATLPGLAALIALLFNWVSVSQTKTQLQIAQQEQFTTRFNVAVTHLGSSSVDVRFGGIYALERIMQDSPRDQPRIIEVLSAYVRTHASVPAGGYPMLKGHEEPPPVDADVTAVTEVLAERPPSQDRRTEINWKDADLRGLELTRRHMKKESGGNSSASRHLPFSFADLSGADLQKADLYGVDLQGASLTKANLAGATLSDVNLSEAFLTAANLTKTATDEEVNLRKATLEDAILVDAQMIGTNLTGAYLTSANLTGAFLKGVNLRHADLGVDLKRDKPGANLTDAVLWRADLTQANLTGANLTFADLLFTDLTDADLMSANLTGADLSLADLSDSDLTQADLSGADLDAADLSDSDLTQADLSGANLSGADLSGANLTRADLRGANLDGADLTGARTDEAIGLEPPS